jgi:hypothetical protein
MQSKPIELVHQASQLIPVLSNNSRPAREVLLRVDDFKAPDLPPTLISRWQP